jgi:hypothetical protein
LLVEAIRIFFPKLYAAIKADPACFLASELEWSFNRVKAEEKTTAKINNALDGLMPDDRDAAGIVIKELFPRVGFFKGNHYGSDWQSRWQKQKRIASTDYFDRYFAYGVPPKDISDRRMDAFVTAAAGEPALELLVSEIRILANTSTKALMSKLWIRESSIPREGVGNIVIAIARCGDLFPHNDGPLGSGIVIGSSLGQACRYIRELLRKIGECNERDKVALEVAERIPTLPFFREYYQAIGKLSDDPDPEYESIVSDNCRNAILQLFASRVAADAKQSSLFDKYGDQALGLLWTWFWADEQSVRDFLAKDFADRPEEAIKFLRQAIDGFGRQESYTSICRIVDPGIVFNSIQKIFPDLRNTEEEFYSQEDWGKRNASIFKEVHEYAVARDNGTSS